MSYLPKGEEKGPGNDKEPSTTRTVLWIVVGGIGLYFLVTGLYAVFTGSSL